jgi:hypothetical protein
MVKKSKGFWFDQDTYKKGSPDKNFRKKTYLGLNFVCILTVDDLFNGSWDENITWFTHQIITLVWFSPGKSDNGAMLEFIVFQFLWIDTLIVVNSTVMFNDTNTQCSGTGQVTTCVQTDITETLYNKCLTTPSWCCAYVKDLERKFAQFALNF